MEAGYKTQSYARNLLKFFLLMIHVLIWNFFSTVTLVHAQSSTGGGSSSCSAYPPAPANALSLGVGTHTFAITGSTVGSGWGTHQYTHDSSIAAMAVHAGIVSDNQSAIIEVHRTDGLSSYDGATLNGVSTSSYGSWHGTYSLALVSLCGGSAPSAPGVPSGLLASNNSPIVGQNFVLTWNSVPEATSYVLFQNGSPTTLYVPSHTIYAAEQGVFQYAVSACNSSGCSALGSSLSLSITHGGGGSSLCTTYSTAPDNAISLALGTHSFVVTGMTAGAGWGTSYYTHDSSIAAMAVHAGIVGDGQSAVINVQRSEGLSSYDGTTLNGVTTSSYGSWHGSYSLSLVELCGSSAPNAPSVPSIPTTFSVSNSSPVAGQSINLSWNAVPEAISYKLFQNTIPSTLYTTTHTTTTVAQGMLTFTVSACNSAGCSAQSNPLHVNVTASSGGGGSTECTAYPTAPGNAYTLSEGVHTFAITGGIDGIGWGTEQYTHDSNIAAMAVHAGLVGIGQSAIIQVHRTPGLSSYIGSIQNGVSTLSFGDWSGTFSLALVNLCGASAPTIPGSPGWLTSSSNTAIVGQSYTLSWGAVTGAASYNLYINGAPISLVNTSYTIPSATQGANSYTVTACNSSGCSAESTSVTVNVSIGQSTSIGLIGFDPDYKGYWSSLPSNNDLYIVRESSDGNREGVTDFILVEQPNGHYTINPDPTPSQIAQFNTAAAGGILFELADINLDGAMDMVLMNSSTEAAGIIYAAPNTQSAPIALKQIDAEFVEFFADLYQGILNPAYFYQTALENGWGSWQQYGPYIFSYWDSSILQLSGQSFVPVGLPPPSEPIPFYANLADAHNPNLLPFWCAINGQGGYRWNGVWEVLGYYREAVFVPDYSYFNQDAVVVAVPVLTYLTTELVAPIPPIVFSILEDLLGVNHGLDDEPAIYNLIRLMGKVLFGFSVEQGTDLPKILAKVELLYTDIGLPALPPFARHAYLQVTFPNGNKYVTRGGPQDEPAFWPFGYIETQFSFNPTPTSGFLDYGKPILYRQLVGHSFASESQVNFAMAAVSDSVNTCDIPYLLITSNSNTYAFQSVLPVSGLPRPRPQVWAPGAAATIPCP